jgi:two-component system chemotaxis response regulator CheY
VEDITSWKNLKVLVIDDSKVARHIMCNMLREMGVTHVFEAEDGWKALEFKSTSFDLTDLIVCDWNMPGLSGLEVLKHFQETSSAHAFLMVSGRCDPKSILEARDAGVDGYIRKPFSCDELQTKIATVLMQKSTSKNKSGVATTGKRATYGHEKQRCRVGYSYGSYYRRFKNNPADDLQHAA